MADELRALGKRHARTRVASAASSQALTDAIRKAVDEGMPKTEIAKLTGLSRRAVYDALAPTSGRD